MNIEAPGLNLKKPSCSLRKTLKFFWSTRQFYTGDSNYSMRKPTKKNILSGG